jgi:hypothetical protein
MVLAGSVNVFQETAVAAGPGVGETDAFGSEAVGPDVAGPLVPPGPAPALEDVSGWAVHAGALPPGAVHPATSVPAASSTAARKAHDVALHLMPPA